MTQPMQVRFRKGDTNLREQRILELIILRIYKIDVKSNTNHEELKYIRIMYVNWTLMDAYFS